MGMMDLLKWTEDGIEQRLHLIRELAPHWEEIGSQIGLTPAQLNGWRIQHFNVPGSCMRSVAATWMERKNENVSTMTNEWYNIIASV